MANVTLVTLEEHKQLLENVKVIGGNLDQMFLIFMGCLIFCKYRLDLILLSFKIASNFNPVRTRVINFRYFSKLSVAREYFQMSVMLKCQRQFSATRYKN